MGSQPGQGKKHRTGVQIVLMTNFFHDISMTLLTYIHDDRTTFLFFYSHDQTNFAYLKSLPSNKRHIDMIQLQLLLYTREYIYTHSQHKTQEDII